MSDLICIGAIAGAFGVSGEVRLKSFCSEPTDIGTYGPLSTEDGSRMFQITLTRPVSGGLGARIQGVNSKEQADALRGTSLYVSRDRLPSLPDDEFYHADLIGLSAYDTGGALIGKVSAIYNHGAGDIVEIATNRHKSALLLPFTTAIVPNVDLAAGRIVVNLPEETEE
ncbi:ribosome maturation factor RimM [Tabrizicola sp.]|jgi:16S rRNA processing protein RimM|uniref:ribosome maturation factor RimM n=1 Tax=Tabrizicola sp. TaxID=2005166 RepID=UPI001A5B61A0|nr:ribosome maturation factor RimM [Tabrizicola sp.]MBL9062431.1 16S rRNA processing protein RimM [Tabrizicola sp.]